MTDNKYEWGEMDNRITGDENVNRAVAGFSWIQNKLLKRCVLRACLNEGVEFMEQMSKRDCSGPRGQRRRTFSERLCLWLAHEVEAVGRRAKLIRGCVFMQ